MKLEPLEILQKLRPILILFTISNLFVLEKEALFCVQMRNVNTKLLFCYSSFFQGNIFMFQIDCPFVWILNLFFFLCIIIFICIFFVVYIKSIHSTEDVVVLRRQAKDKYEYSIITERNGLAKLYL